MTTLLWGPVTRTPSAAQLGPNVDGARALFERELIRSLKFMIAFGTGVLMRAMETAGETRANG